MCHPKIRNPNSRKKKRADVSQNVSRPQSGNMNNNKNDPKKTNMISQWLPSQLKNWWVGVSKMCGWNQVISLPCAPDHSDNSPHNDLVVPYRQGAPRNAEDLQYRGAGKSILRCFHVFLVLYFDLVWKTCQFKIMIISSTQFLPSKVSYCWRLRILWRLTCPKVGILERKMTPLRATRNAKYIQLISKLYFIPLHPLLQ